MSSLFRPTAISIYVLFLLIGAVSALVLPTLSFFLDKELGVRPLLVSLPFSGIAIMGILYNHFIGHWSDSWEDRRPLVSFFCLVGTLACLILAYSRHYWLIAGSVIFLLSLAMVSYSQMLAYSLDYAKHNIPAERIPLFNAIVRAQIAIAWVAGPACGFLLKVYLGFHLMHIIAAVTFLLIACAVFILLPNLHAAHPPSANQEPPSPLTRFQKHALALSVIGFSCMWGANNAYLISIPLHLKDDMGISEEWLGWVMGLSAFLEIPFMLLAGHYAARVKTIYWIMLSGLAALLLNIGIYFAASIWQVFAVQIFNAIFIGVLAGLGVSIIQDLLPGRAGFSSGLYTNTTSIGNLIGGLLVGLVAEHFGYHQVFIANMFIIAVAILAFGRVRKS